MYIDKGFAIYVYILNIFPQIIVLEHGIGIHLNLEI